MRKNLAANVKISAVMFSALFLFGCVTSGPTYKHFDRSSMTLDQCAEHGSKLLLLSSMKALGKGKDYRVVADDPAMQPYAEDIENAYKGFGKKYTSLMDPLLIALEEYSSCGLDNESSSVPQSLMACPTYAQLTAGTFSGIMHLDSKEETIGKFKTLYGDKFPEGENYINSMYDKVYGSGEYNNVGNALKSEVLNILLCISKKGKP